MTTNEKSLKTLKLTSNIYKSCEPIHTGKMASRAMKSQLLEDAQLAVTPMIQLRLQEVGYIEVAVEGLGRSRNSEKK